jgi:hypothetical protein
MNLSGVNGNVIMSGCGDATLTMKEEKRLTKSVSRDELMLGQAALAQGASKRQFYRAWSVRG